LTGDPGPGAKALEHFKNFIAMRKTMAQLPRMTWIASEFEENSKRLILHFIGYKGQESEKAVPDKLNIWVPKQYAFVIAAPNDNVHVRFQNMTGGWQALGEVTNITINQRKDKAYALYPGISDVGSVRYEGTLELAVIDTELLKQLLGVPFETQDPPYDIQLDEKPVKVAGFDVPAVAGDIVCNEFGVPVAVFDGTTWIATNIKPSPETEYVPDPKFGIGNGVAANVQAAIDTLEAQAMMEQVKASAELAKIVVPDLLEERNW